HFLHPDLVHFSERLATLAAELDPLSAEGAWTERKVATVAVHYRGVELARRAKVAERARAHISASGFQPRDGLFTVEAWPPIGWDTGHAVLHVMRQRYGPTWSGGGRVVYLGADPTDEDAFRVLAGLGATLRINGADSLTFADRWLPNVDAARALLEWGAGRPGWEGAVRCCGSGGRRGGCGGAPPPRHPPRWPRNQFSTRTRTRCPSTYSEA